MKPCPAMNSVTRELNVAEQCAGAGRRARNNRRRVRRSPQHRDASGEPAAQPSAVVTLERRGARRGCGMHSRRRPRRTAEARVAAVVEQVCAAVPMATCATTTRHPARWPPYEAMSSGRRQQRRCASGASPEQAAPGQRELGVLRTLSRGSVAHLPRRGWAPAGRRRLASTEGRPSCPSRVSVHPLLQLPGSAARFRASRRGAAPIERGGRALGAEAASAQVTRPTPRSAAPTSSRPRPGPRTRAELGAGGGFGARYGPCGAGRIRCGRSRGRGGRSRACSGRVRAGSCGNAAGDLPCPSPAGLV